MSDSLPRNPSKGGSLKWAWVLIDRRRARGNVSDHQISEALKAIALVHGRAPIRNSSTYEFSDEEILRTQAMPR